LNSSRKSLSISLIPSLLHPRVQLRALDAASPSLSHLPLLTWLWLILIAVGGSVIYGASLSLVLPQWRPTEGALWMALSAGLSWCVFGPALSLLTCRNAFVLAHACLVTMAYGEAVLVTGAALNALLALTGTKAVLSPAVFNLALVALANAAMAVTLSAQLQAIGVPIGKTLLAWMLILNGSGALFFWLFRRLLQGGF
jgi:hypothetical protein